MAMMESAGDVNQEIPSHAVATTTATCSKETGPVASMLVEPAISLNEAPFLNPNL